MLDFLKRNHLLSGILISSVTIVILFVFIISLDLYYHKKLSRSAGLNWQGYRGRVVGEKKKNEIRIVLLGGSCAFGYGALPEVSISSHLEKKLNVLMKANNIEISVVNLAYNNESAVCYKSTLKSYECLNPDIILLYSGYNDSSPGFSYYRDENQCFRNSQIIFRLTGYMPILPLAIKEKYFKLRYGDIGMGYKEDEVWGVIERVFSFDLVDKEVLDKKGKLEDAQLEEAAIKSYIGYIDDIFQLCLDKDRGFIFIRQPWTGKSVFPNRMQERLRHHLKKYEGIDKFIYVNLLNIFQKQKPKEFFVDGLHLTGKGNERVADALTKPMISMILKAFLNNGEEKL